MTYTATAGSVAGVITTGIMSTTGIMVGGATALGTGTQDLVSMAASPGMAAAVSMAASPDMAVAARMVVAAEATVEVAAPTVLFSRPSALRCHLSFVKTASNSVGGDPALVRDGGWGENRTRDEPVRLMGNRDDRRDTCSSGGDGRSNATPPRTLSELFLGFLSIGARSFGGVLPAAHHVMVEKRRWLTAADFTETIGLCQVLPGPNIGNASIVLGKRWFGLAGAVVAFLALFALPYLWVLVLALVYTSWAAHALVSAAVTGLGASGAGLFIANGVKLGRPLARKPAAVALIAGCFIALAIARMPLLIVMPVALIVGMLLARKRLL